MMMSGKRLLENPCFELAAKGSFRLGRCYVFWQGVPGLQASNWEQMKDKQELMPQIINKKFPKFVQICNKWHRKFHRKTQIQ